MCFIRGVIEIPFEEFSSMKFSHVYIEVYKPKYINLTRFDQNSFLRSRYNFTHKVYEITLF